MELYIAWYGKCINQCLMKEAELLVLTEKKKVYYRLLDLCNCEVFVYVSGDGAQRRQGMELERKQM